MPDGHTQRNDTRKDAKFLISLETVKSVRSPIPLGNLIANLEMLVMAGSLEIIAGSLIIIMVRSLALLNNLLKN